MWISKAKTAVSKPPQEDSKWRRIAGFNSMLTLVYSADAIHVAAQEEQAPQSCVFDFYRPDTSKISSNACTVTCFADQATPLKSQDNGCLTATLFPFKGF